MKRNETNYTDKELIMTTKRYPPLAILLIAGLFLFVACDSDDGSSAGDTTSADVSVGETEEESLEGHVCLHFEEGPAVAVTAAADESGELPDGSEMHHRIDVTLVDLAEGTGGWVAYQSASEGHGVLFVDADLNVTIVDAAGTELELQTEALTGDCDMVAAAWEAELEVGLYHIFFDAGAAADSSMVSFVMARPSDDHEHEHEE